MSVYGKLYRWWTRRRQAWRLWHYRRLGVEIGNRVRFYGPVHITWPANVTIGHRCTINEGVIIGGRGGVSIGHDVRISAGAFIETGYLEAAYYTDGANVWRKHGSQPIVIADNVWIGAGAKVLAGVTVGRNSVVAAGAVVTKHVPPDSIAMGIPATFRPAPPPHRLEPPEEF